MLATALQGGYDEARKIAASCGFVEARTEPTLAFDLSIKALDQFEDINGVERLNSRGQHLWSIGGVYGLRVKKLGPGYRPMNHVSAQQRRMARFEPLEGLDPLVYVTAGPHHSPLTGLPMEYVVVKHYPGAHGKQAVEWVVDLEELAAGVGDARTPVLDLPGAPTAPATVRRRKRDGDAAES